MDKLKEVLGSKNFLVTIFTIISSIFAYNNVELDLNPEETADKFKNLPVGAVLTTAIILFINPITKIIKSAMENGFNFEFLKSSNFWIQIGSAVLLIVGAYFDILDLIISIIGAGVANTINLGYHSVLVPVKEICSTEEIK